METDNIEAFEILLRQDPNEVEAEGLTEVIQQINILMAEYNKEKERE